MRLLVTGGAGFIGSAVIRAALDDPRYEIVNVDKLTYAAAPEALAAHHDDSRYRFERADVADAARIKALFERHDPDAVMHLAAETHVDRSIDGPAVFVQTNVVGTQVMLDAALAHWRRLSAARAAAFRFHHVSTDEVFGSLGPEGAFTEATPYAPSSPYSASKAASDHLARAWGQTYGLPVLVSNCSNNFGPWQFPEKLIPLTIANALEGRPLPVYGTGENIRDWLFVEDHARALLTILRSGRPGESYNVGGEAERRNIDVVREVARLVDAAAGPLPGGMPRDRLVSFVADRPGHDYRYAMDGAKIASELGWRPRETFESGLRRTVDWYLAHQTWWRRLRRDVYDGARLGRTA